MSPELKRGYVPELTIQQSIINDLYISACLKTHVNHGIGYKYYFYSNRFKDEGTFYKVSFGYYKNSGHNYKQTDFKIQYVTPK